MKKHGEVTSSCDCGATFKYSGPNSNTALCNFLEKHPCSKRGPESHYYDELTRRYDPDYHQVPPREPVVPDLGDEPPMPTPNGYAKECGIPPEDHPYNEGHYWWAMGMANPDQKRAFWCTKGVNKDG